MNQKTSEGQNLAFAKATQQKLLTALQGTTNAKALANIMLVIAQQGDADSVRPLLQAISVRPLLYGSSARNDGNTMLDAALKLCTRHKDIAQEYLLEILSEPEPKTTKALGIIFDKEYLAALARRDVAAEVMARLYGGSGESLADNLFQNARKSEAK
jgi:hypothetical protein